MKRRPLLLALLIASLVLPIPAEAGAGREHLRVPALGISVPVGLYGCHAKKDPPKLPAGVFRWGCNDPSNRYLLGHSWSTFRKLRGAYLTKRLRVGMTATYRGPDGVNRHYRVAWVRRTTLRYFDRTFREWATNATPDVRSLTLQTCDGARSQYRIVVRFEEA